jgi:hypothetical protein
MIIWKNGDLTLEQDPYTGKYAIFERIWINNWVTSHWEQRTKWYKRKGYCERVWRNKVATAIVNHTYKHNTKVGECII